MITVVVLYDTRAPLPLYADLSEVRPGAGPRRRGRRPVRVAVLVKRVLWPVWKLTSEILRWTFVSLHAIEPTRLPLRRGLRVVKLVRQVEAAVALLGDLDAI